MKTVLITGVTSGFGRVMAEAFCAAGYEVYGAARRAPAKPDPCLRGFFAADLYKPDAAGTLVGQVLEQAGRIDVLVNNAGMGFGGALEETSQKELEQIFRLNFFAAASLCQSVLPHMRKQGSGRIINISSLGGRIGLPFQGAYSATKYALEGYSEALYNEVRPFGIFVSLIEPGDFHTGFTGNRRRTERKEKAYETAYAAALRKIEHDELQGSDPKSVGKLAVKIARANAPRLRYAAGGFGERILIRLRGLLRDRVFLFFVRKYYGG